MGEHKRAYRGDLRGERGEDGGAVAAVVVGQVVVIRVRPMDQGAPGRRLDRSVRDRPEAQR
jgi:hypothetical protein